MKYRISTIGKIKSNDEDLITRKYLKRIKNIELKQYEVKTKNKEKQLDKEADKLIDSTPKNGKLILLDEEGENLSSSDLAKLILNWSNNNITSVNFAIGGAFGNGQAAASEQAAAAMKINFEKTHTAPNELSNFFQS